MRNKLGIGKVTLKKKKKKKAEIWNMNNRNYSKLVREQFFFESVAKTTITEHLTAKEKKAFQQEIYAIF